MRYSYLLLFSLCLLLFSCTKDANHAKSTCETTFLGYRTTVDTITYDTVAPLAEWGIISGKTATMKRVVYIKNTPKFNQAAYHSGNMCYYTFLNKSDTEKAVLYQIRPDGMVTEFRDSLSGSKYDGLVFMKGKQRLYAFKSTYGATNDWLCELSLNGENFLPRIIVAGIGRSTTNATINSVADNSTGNIFYIVASDKTTTLVRINPEKAQVAEIFSKAKPYELHGLCFHESEKVMYGVAKDTSGFHLVKISTGGEVTTIDTLKTPNDIRFMSAAIDECTNDYVLTSRTSGYTGYLIRMNIDRKTTITLSTNQIFQGLSQMK